MGSASVEVEELDLLLVSGADGGVLGVLFDDGDLTGLAIRQVAGVDAAMQAYAHRPADCVVLYDPTGTGLDHAMVHTLLAQHPRPCVIVVSDDAEAGERALHAGVEDLVPTSAVAPASLRQIVSRAVERHAAAERRSGPQLGPPTGDPQGTAQRLRTPLSVIVSSLESLRDGRGDADDLVQRGLRASYALGGEVDQLLAAQRRSESGGRSAIDLAELVESVCSDLGGLADAEGAHVSVAPMPVVWGREDPLRMLVRQLLVNALQHGGQGVHIRVSSELRQRGVRLFIDDDGPGIAPPLRASAFAVQARGAVEPRNTGYGLPAVGAVAAMHGGRVWIEDSPFGGTRVVVELPIRRRRDEHRGASGTI